MRIGYMKNLLMIVVGIFNFFACSQNNPQVLIKTEMGDIKAEIYLKEAPVTASNFLRYVKENRFEGITFYRVVREGNQPNNDIKIQVIQGGLKEDNHPLALPPIAHETTEQTGMLHKDGVLTMARYGPGTAAADFAICIDDQPELDFDGKRNPDGHGFATFGRVIEGMDVVKKIHKQPAEGQRLTPEIKILNIVLAE